MHMEMDGTCDTQESQYFDKLMELTEIIHFNMPSEEDDDSKQSLMHPGFPETLPDPDRAHNRISLSPTCSEKTLVDNICSKNLINWGIIKKPDGVPMFQFVLKGAEKKQPRRAKTPSPKIMISSAMLNQAQAHVSVLPAPKTLKVPLGSMSENEVLFRVPNRPYQ